MKFTLRDIIDYDLGLQNGRELYVPLTVVEGGMQSLIELYSEKGLVGYFAGVEDYLNKYTDEVFDSLQVITEEEDTIKATTSIEVPSHQGGVNVSGVPVALLNGVMYVHHDFVYTSAVLSVRLFTTSKGKDIQYDKVQQLTLNAMYSDVVPDILVDKTVEALKEAEEMFLPVLSYPRVLTHSNMDKLGSVEGHEGLLLDDDTDENLVIDLDLSEMFELDSSASYDLEQSYTYLTNLTVLIPNGDSEPIRLDILDVPLVSDLIIPEFLNEGSSSKDDYLIILEKSAESGELSAVSEVSPDTPPSILAEELLEFMDRESYRNTQEYIAILATLIDSDIPHGLEGHVTVPYEGVMDTVLEAREQHQNETNNDTEEK